MRILLLFRGAPGCGKSTFIDRNGKYLGEDGKPAKEFFDMVHDYESRLEHAKEHSVLPPKPDYGRIDEFLMKANWGVLYTEKYLKNTKIDDSDVIFQGR